MIESFVRNGMRVEPFTARDSGAGALTRDLIGALDKPGTNLLETFVRLVKDLWTASRISLVWRFESTYFIALPNFARACGRVSVGRYPDKRPDSRPERDRDASLIAKIIRIV